MLCHYTIYYTYSCGSASYFYGLTCTDPLKIGYGQLTIPTAIVTAGGASGSPDPCPAPPKVSIVDRNASSLSGPLDSWSDYVAERLLQQGADLNPVVFFNRYQVSECFYM